MNKKSLITIVCIFCFLYIFNYFMPKCFGDDYLYSFVWQGQPMYVPLPENAIRVNSFRDLLVSQWSHYLTWSGRTVAHVLIQFFLWAGKDIFNIFNAMAGTVLVMEIYWCIHNGKVSFGFESCKLFWIFFVLWTFAPDFSPVFFWLTGACNYLWTNVLLLSFLIPYIQKYYASNSTIRKNCFFNPFMFILGVFAGWTNENSVCWIILLLMIFIFRQQKHGDVEYWMYTGLAGLILGYTLLMFAPGNVMRLHTGHGRDFINIQVIFRHLKTFFQVFIYQFLLWYFCIRSVCQFKEICFNEAEKMKSLKREILLVKSFLIISFGMSFIMVFSPEFPIRSGFLGMIPLIISAGILLRLQKDFGIELITNSAIKFLTVIGVFYFVMTSTVSLNNYHKRHLQMDKLLRKVYATQAIDRDTILVVQPFNKASRLETCISGFHIIDNDLSEDETRWENVAFARYYGVKGIKCIKSDG